MVEEYTFKPVEPNLRIRRLETPEDLRKLATKMNDSFSASYTYVEQKQTVYINRTTQADDALGTYDAYKHNGHPFASLGYWLVWYDGIDLDVVPYRVFDKTKTLNDILKAMEKRTFWVQIEPIT